MPAIAPVILRHSLRPWRSDAGGRAPTVGALGDAGAITGDGFSNKGFDVGESILVTGMFQNLSQVATRLIFIFI
jgi:hypothetical protein